MSQPADSLPPPDWAIKQASASLQGGMSAPEVEQRLVGVGLTPQAAKDVILRARTQPSEAPPMLDWAMEHVRAALRIGIEVPDIERQLVARGLTPEVAEAVVTNVLGERVRADQPNTPERQRRRFLHRMLSGVVAFGCVVLEFWFGGGFSAGRDIFCLLLPTTCIWFGDAPWFRKRFPQSSVASGVVVRWLGWLVLLLYFLYQVELVLYKP